MFSEELFLHHALKSREQTPICNVQPCSPRRGQDRSRLPLLTLPQAARGAGCFPGSCLSESSAARLQKQAWSSGGSGFCLGSQVICLFYILAVALGSTVSIPQLSLGYRDSSNLQKTSHRFNSTQFHINNTPKLAVNYISQRQCCLLFSSTGR